MCFVPFPSEGTRCFIMHLFSCSPSGLGVLYLPTRCPSTCQRLMLTAAAVANKLFSHAAPEWEPCAVEWRLRQRHSLRLKLCSCVTSLLKHLWLRSLHAPDIHLEFNTLNELGLVLGDAAEEVMDGRNKRRGWMRSSKTSRTFGAQGTHSPLGEES